MRLGKNFAIYLTASVVAGALPLALMPFLTHQLTPTEYGAMVTITTIVAMIAPIVNWATTAYVAVQFFKVERAQFPALLGTILIIPAINTAGLLALCLLGRGALAHWFDVPAAWAIAMPFMAASLLLPQIVQTILAMRDRALGYAAIEIAGAVLNFAATVMLVGYLDFGWEGRVIAQAAAGAFLTAVALLWLLKERLLAVRYTADEFRDAWRFGAGTVAHDLANQALRLSDRLLIVSLLGQAAVGSYAVAVQWSSIMLTILAAFNRAWVPYLFSALSAEEPGWARRIVKQTYLVWGALLLLLAGFAIATPIGYSLLIDNRYHGSMPATFFLILGYFFNGIYMTVVDYIFYLKKTHILAAITTLNLALNTGLAFVLIGIYGALGAAIAFAVTACFVMMLTFFIANRLRPMPWFQGFAR